MLYQTLYQSFNIHGMLIKEYRTHFIQQLTTLYGVDEAESFFYLIIENLRKMKRIDVALNYEAIFTPKEIDYWNRLLEALKKGKPIQYLLGKTSFCGFDFEVNANVLIPRPETQELVMWIITENKYKKKLKILDIGTGSGCIAITLAKFLPQATVFAIDVSQGALATAKKNASAHNVIITFIQKDIFIAEKLSEKFDVIVSNPPYIRNLEKKEIHKNVLDNEPHLALFVPDENPLLFYRKISELALENLISKGILYFEINQYLGPEMITLLSQKGFQNIQLRKDIYNNDRMLKGEL